MKVNSRRVTRCRDFFLNDLLSGDSTKICQLLMRLEYISYLLFRLSSSSPLLPSLPSLLETTIAGGRWKLTAWLGRAGWTASMWRMNAGRKRGEFDHQQGRKMDLWAGRGEFDLQQGVEDGPLGKGLSFIARVQLLRDFKPWRT